MSTLKTTNIQHPSASTPAITLDSTGAMTGSFPYPNRNLLYNGAMQVAQRGTSTTGITAAGYYTADRWRYGTTVGSIGTWTQDIQSDAPAGSGFRSSLRMLCTTAQATPTATNRIAVVQRLEGQDLQRIKKGTSAAEKLSLSFWVKSNVTGTYIIELIDNNNTRQVCASYNILSSGTWEYKTIILPADTSGVLNNNNEASFTFSFCLAAGSDLTSGTLATSWESVVNANRAVGQTNLAAATNNYWQVTGVQLETGPVATPFEFKSYGQELRECQRYYYRIQPGEVSKVLSTGALVVSASILNAQFHFPVTLRVAPTALEQSGVANNYSVNAGGTVIQCSSVPTHGGISIAELGVANFIVSTGLVARDSGRAQTDGTNGASAYLAWSAEL